jgi:hypothetical protein
MNIKITKDWAPFFIAIAVALIVVVYYVVSGRGSYDLNVRQLGQNTQIESVNAQNPKNIIIKCKNGESYSIVFKKDQPDYESLIFNSCGAGGGEADQGSEEQTATTQQ